MCEQELRDLAAGGGMLRPKIRQEGDFVPEGLSVTLTHISEFWRYREGDVIHMLHLRKTDGHSCYEVSSYV